MRLKWVNKVGFSGEEGLSCMGVGRSVELVLRVGHKCLFIGEGGGWGGKADLQLVTLAGQVGYPLYVKVGFIWGRESVKLVSMGRRGFSEVGSTGGGGGG